MNGSYQAALGVCKRHAERLAWAMAELRPRFPLATEKLSVLSGAELAVLDQFSTRFAKLQDAMGAKLFMPLNKAQQDPAYCRYPRKRLAQRAKPHRNIFRQFYLRALLKITHSCFDRLSTNG